MLLYTQSPHITTLTKKSFENIVVKGENAGNNVFYSSVFILGFEKSGGSARTL